MSGLDEVEQLAELVGFYLTHAAWCIVDGEVLCPLIGYEAARWPRAWVDSPGPAGAGRSIVRFDAEEYGDAVERARTWVARNEERASRVALVFDGFVTVDGQRSDALIVEARNFGARPLAWRLVARYRPRTASQAFGITPPAVMSGADDAALSRLERALSRGMAQHPEEGIWRRHRIERIDLESTDR